MGEWRNKRSIFYMMCCFSRRETQYYPKVPKSSNLLMCVCRYFSQSHFSWNAMNKYVLCELYGTEELGRKIIKNVMVPLCRRFTLLQQLYTIYNIGPTSHNHPIRRFSGLMWENCQLLWYWYSPAALVSSTNKTGTACKWP